MVTNLAASAALFKTDGNASQKSARFHCVFPRSSLPLVAMDYLNLLWDKSAMTAMCKMEMDATISAKCSMAGFALMARSVTTFKIQVRSLISFRCTAAMVKSKLNMVNSATMATKSLAMAAATNAKWRATGAARSTAAEATARRQQPAQPSVETEWSNLQNNATMASLSRMAMAAP